MEVSRRKALSELGSLAMGTFALSAGVSFHANSANAQEKKPKTSLPWVYSKLDPMKSAQRAYKGYFTNACMFGAFDAIIGELADIHGDPFASFPSEMMAYGKGGVASWGSLCGALNGAAAAIQLVSKDPKKLISELYAWSEQTALPNVNLKIQATKDDHFPSSVPVTSSVSDSVLCHIIMSKWVAASGKGIDSPEKKQRCGQFSASIAMKTVQLLNGEKDGKLVLMYPLADTTQKCTSCHSGKTSVLKNTQGMMDCQACHVDHTK